MALSVLLRVLLIPRNETSVSWPRIAPVASQLADGCSGLIIAEQLRKHQLGKQQLTGGESGADAGGKQICGKGKNFGRKEAAAELQRQEVSELFRRLLGGDHTQSQHTAKEVQKHTEHKLDQLCLAGFCSLFPIQPYSEQ